MTLIVIGTLIGWALTGAWLVFKIRERRRRLRTVFYCYLCGERVEATPTRELIRNAHQVVFCASCIPAGTLSQMAEVSQGPRVVKPVGRCNSCPCDLWTAEEGEKHHRAGHRLEWHGIHDPYAPPNPRGKAR